tara:strand:- start:537 stop:782 length:246 start_codon:yes stop_codon:yes gene_type:complete
MKGLNIINGLIQMRKQEQFLKGNIGLCGMDKMVEKTDIHLIKIYEKLKTTMTPDFLLAVDVQNELFDRGWNLNDKNEWTWR